MPFALTWDDDYSIGHDVIDSEHKKLFEIASQIFAVKNPLKEMSEIQKFIHELYDYMKQHFQHEEEYMADVAYSDAEMHKEKHAEIIDEMNNIVKLSKNFIQIENSLVTLMRRWLLDHILKEDLKVKKAIDIHESANAEAVKSR